MVFTYNRSYDLADGEQLVNSSGLLHLFRKQFPLGTSVVEEEDDGEGGIRRLEATVKGLAAVDAGVGVEDGAHHGGTIVGHAEVGDRTVVASPDAEVAERKSVSREARRGSDCEARLDIAAGSGGRRRPAAARGSLRSENPRGFLGGRRKQEGKNGGKILVGDERGLSMRNHFGIGEGFDSIK
ncbi:hypothetical protein Taro_017559 [Colocasia esculenta]|uniref:Uncharacterized protein n=1 Tax=Colocasia esculenta TaxID=4460 RepID=A0A843URG1_COLES|nr:hypothetical protein [Colocasia esculenta]